MSVMIYWSEVLDVVLWIVHPSSSNFVYRLQRRPYVQRVNSRKWNEITAELGKRERNIHVSRDLMIRSWCPSRDLVLTNSTAGGTLRIRCWFSRQRLHTRHTDQCNFHGSAQLLLKVISAVMVFPFRWYRASRCIDYLSSRVLATATACLECGESWVCTSRVSTEELRSVSRYVRSGHRSLLPLCIALMKRKILILAPCVEHCIDCTCVSKVANWAPCHNQLQLILPSVLLRKLKLTKAISSSPYLSTLQT